MTDNNNNDWWQGVGSARVEHHDQVYARYGHDDLLANYRFALTEDLQDAEVVSDIRNDSAANGIWTLAEVLATSDPPDWSVIDSAANRMRAAARRHTEQIKSRNQGDS